MIHQALSHADHRRGNKKAAHRCNQDQMRTRCDSPDFVRILKKLRPARQSVKLVVADKGCDSESDHEFSHVSLRARTMILVKGLDRPGIRIRGHYRRKRRRDFDTKAYHRRAIVETAHSVEKRKMGDSVSAKSVGRLQRGQILRVFAYNIARFEATFLSFLRDFHRA